MKMHNYIIPNLLSVSSYAALWALHHFAMEYYQDVAYAKANNLDVDIYGMAAALPIALVILAFIYWALFLFICFLIEFFIRVKFKKEGFCIRFKSEILRVIHVILLYLGIALAPFINPFWRIM
ncbi:TPA: hypothetical protein IAA68_01530 [Candidatus Galligastranaerophilus faecipullorum]|nr:hypothetical protein [Candidatus Galligastranaerophilus faecipullorum]